jgi:hypothetical protein
MRHYGLKNAVIIADSGLLSKKNIEFTEASGYKYILGARLKKLPQKWQKIINVVAHCFCKSLNNITLQFLTVEVRGISGQ